MGGGALDKIIPPYCRCIHGSRRIRKRAGEGRCVGSELAASILFSSVIIIFSQTSIEL